MWVARTFETNSGLHKVGDLARLAGFAASQSEARRLGHMGRLKITPGDAALASDSVFIGPGDPVTLAVGDRAATFVCIKHQ